MPYTSIQREIVEVDISRFITIDDVVSNAQEFLELNHIYSSQYLLLVNATNCRTNIGIKDLDNLQSLNTELAEKFSLLKVAVIVNDPVYTAICMVYQQLIKMNYYHFRVFSTKLAARRWLLS